MWVEKPKTAKVTRTNALTIPPKIKDKTTAAKIIVINPCHLCVAPLCLGIKYW